MDPEKLAILALIQGLTEFLPISSSAHLILPHEVLGWPDQGPLIDVAVHVGSLFAVMLYFRRDMGRLLVGAGDLARQRLTPDSRLALHLGLASVPVLVGGGLLYASGLVDHLRSAEVIAWSTIIFALLLLEADRLGQTTKRVETMTLSGALAIGLAQMLALVPGTSRAGITMTMGRFLGYGRREAARFAMLLSIPTIAAFGLIAAIEVVRTGGAALSRDALLAGGLSFLAAYASIAAFMALVERIGLVPFVAYRLVLGGALLIYVYG